MGNGSSPELEFTPALPLLSCHLIKRLPNEGSVT